MNKERLRKQMQVLDELYIAGECFASEWYSVGMEPPKDDVLKLKAIGRKIARIARQLKIEWD